MKPNKISNLQDQQDDQADLSDIAQIFHKLSNCNRSNAVKPYSQYDPESIFPPPSQISANINGNQSQKSKSNNFVNVWKRAGICQVKQEISFGSKYQINGKRVKKIQVQKVTLHVLPTPIQFKQDQVSNKDSILNIKEHINIQPPQSNSKITDFFKQRKSSLVQKTCQNDKQKIKQQQKLNLVPGKVQKIYSFNQIEDQKRNNFINSLKQKNQKKRKTIQQLKQQLMIIKARKQQGMKKLQKQKQQQKQKLKIKLLQTNQRKIQFQQYKSDMYSYLNKQRIQRQFIPQVDTKIKSLQEHKKKASQRKGNSKKQIHTDQQSIGNIGPQNYNQNPHQIPDKKNYLNQWMSKLQKFKQRIEADNKYYQKLYRVNRKIQKIPDQIQEVCQKNNLLKDYVLFNIQYPFAKNNTNAQELTLVNCFNLQQLRPQILTLLKYPKLLNKTSKVTIQKQLGSLFKLSKKLHNSANFYFLQTTIASQVGQNSQYIIYGRQKNQDYESLMDVLKKYDTFSQVMIRYIARVCLIALEQVKIKIDIPLFILPSNIYFTSKYDIKFANLLMNNLLLHDQFKPYLKEQNFYYYVAPQALSQKDNSNLPVWSLGILLYFLIYQKYPFQYDYQKSFQKQTFFIYHNITFPTKPVVNQKLKDFINICLTGRQKDINQLQKHPFFNK